MTTLKINISEMGVDNNDLSTSIDTFQDDVATFENSIIYSSYQDLTESISLYKREIICPKLDSLCEKLNVYIKGLSDVVDTYQGEEEKKIGDMDDILIPDSLSNLASHCVSWYSSDISTSLLSSYAISSALVGVLSNIVTSGNPQAATEFDNYIVATNSSGTLYIYDKTTGETITRALDETPHAGGVAYNDGVLYVATGGSTYEYDFEGLVDGSNTSHIGSTKSVITTNNSESTAVSFLTVTDDNKLITGQFKGSGEYYRGGSSSDLIVYDIGEDGSLSKTGTIAIDGSEMTNIQGMCVYNKDGTDYYLLTSSYGRSNSSSSTLYIATLDESGTSLNKVGSYTLPSGAEQISTTSDGNVMVIYEGVSSKEEIDILDPDKIIDGIS